MKKKVIDVVLRIECEESFKVNSTLEEINNPKNKVELLCIGVSGETIKEFKHKKYGEGVELKEIEQ